MPSQAVVAKPRALMPKSGRHTFLLKLGPRSTHEAFAANRVNGTAEAKAAAKQQLKAVNASQAAVTSRLPQGSKVLYRTHAATNAIAVVTDARNVDSLRGIAGVKEIYPITPKKPSNAYAAPLVGAPAAWQAFGSLGADISIAIVDTGIDYTHANFGGPGTEMAYATAHANEDQPANPARYPSDKVVGGFDFVGDAYDASSDGPAGVPHPDPNPLDCNGHGSHVAGTAAGYGENANGTTYAGAYNAATPFATMKIGPGMAPLGDLYAYRVFGCDGSSNVVGQAMDRAADPNNDGDTSDHVDVINMSLGTDYGSSLDGDSQLANDLVEMGINVVVASGNGGDLYDVGGSPGNAPRTLTVANSVDASSVIDALSVTAPAGIAGDGYGAERSVAYDWANDPDLAGTLAAIGTVANKDGCDPLAPADAALVAGKVAFLEWTADDTVRRCGSVGRSTNVANAGAIGFVFADDEETFSAGITGSTAIPGVMVTKSAGDILRAHLGDPVVVDGTIVNGFNQLFPGDNDLLNDGSSRNSRGPGGIKPDVAAVGTSVFSTAVGAGDGGKALSGTSMATPQVAGLTALVVGKHPAWTPEEVKADVMNTAGQDLFTEAGHTGDIYAPNRVGSGRIQAEPALVNEVVAYVQDDPGAVSVSFGPLEVTAATVLTKTVKVANKGVTSATYDVEYQDVTSIPGATYSVTPSQVTVAGGASTTFEVKLTIDPTQLTKTRDATLDVTQGGDPRVFIADASGRVELTSVGRPSLRVPVYSAPRPASQMTAQSSLTVPAGAQATANLAFSGSSVDQGVGPERVRSLMAAFELQAKSGPAPQCGGAVVQLCVNNADERSADLKAVGTAVNTFGADPVEDGWAYFAINTQGPWHTPASMQGFEIYLDTDRDGTDDYVTVNTRLGETDVMVAATFRLSDGEPVDIEGINDVLGNTDTALLDSDTMVLPVNLGAIGVTPGDSRINYSIVAYSNQQGSPVDVVEGLSFDPLNPGITIEDGDNLLWIDEAAPLEINRDKAAYEADGGLGLLIAHFHNVNGSKSQEVSLTTVSTSNVSLALAPTSVGAGGSVTGTVTVAKTAAPVPTGTVTLKTPQGVLGSGPLDATGKAVITFKPMPVGSYAVTASYSGDGSYQAGDSAAASLTVTKNASTVDLKLNKLKVKAGKKVKATVSVATVNGLVPTGSVTVKAGKKTLGTAALVNGTVTIKVKISKPGKKKLYAEYAGDGNFAAGKSAKVKLKVT